MSTMIESLRDFTAASLSYEVSFLKIREQQFMDIKRSLKHCLQRLDEKIPLKSHNDQVFKEE